MIAALYVQTGGSYFGLPDVDPWDERRDARTYAGPWPVVAHPPCERWGRYWSGGPSAKVRREKGDDGGCFAAALASVRQWGGVLEHPAASSAWAAHGLRAPMMEDGTRRTLPAGGRAAWSKARMATRPGMRPGSMLAALNCRRCGGAQRLASSPASTLGSTLPQSVRSPPKNGAGSRASRPWSASPRRPSSATCSSQLLRAHADRRALHDPAPTHRKDPRGAEIVSTGAHGFGSVWATHGGDANGIRCIESEKLA